MLDIKFLRTDFEKVIESLKHRDERISEEIKSFPELDEKKRLLLQESEQLKNKRNSVSQEVA